MLKGDFPNISHFFKLPLMKLKFLFLQATKTKNLENKKKLLFDFLADTYSKLKIALKASQKLNNLRLHFSLFRWYLLETTTDAHTEQTNIKMSVSGV